MSQWSIGILDFSETVSNSSVLLLTTFWSLTDTVKYSRFISKICQSFDNIYLIVAPCHWPNHWGLIGFNKKTRRGFWGDSLGSYFLTFEQKKYFKNLLQAHNLIEENQNVQYDRLEIPKQPDSWSCGVSVLKTVKTVLEFKTKYIRKIIDKFTLQLTAK